jgi:hypothetical protein
MIKPYRQPRWEIRAQAVAVGMVKWAALLAFIIFWCEVPDVS